MDANNAAILEILEILERIAAALEKGNGAERRQPADFATSTTFVWHAQDRTLKPARAGNIPGMDLLVGIDDHAGTLLRNTRQFAQGYAANNALLWGARGMGKSSLVKAVYTALSAEFPLVLIEILREDLSTLPDLLDMLNAAPEKRFVLFCDDLSFDAEDSAYKSLKAVLEGGIAGRPDNVLFYATSNRRHLMPRDMIENERRTAIHGGESVEEKVSLSDRFGLWLGFYPCDQDQYFAMVEGYAKACALEIGADALRAQALEWSMLRGSRSGRVAWQFIQDLAGRQGKTISAFL